MLERISDAERLTPGGLEMYIAVRERHPGKKVDIILADSGAAYLRTKTIRHGFPNKVPNWAYQEGLLRLSIEALAAQNKLSFMETGVLFYSPGKGGVMRAKLGVTHAAPERDKAWVLYSFTPEGHSDYFDMDSLQPDPRPVLRKPDGRF